MQHCSGVNALKLAADRGSDRVLFSGSRDGTIKRWDLKGGQVHCAATLESHVDWVRKDYKAGDASVLLRQMGVSFIAQWQEMSSA